MEKCIAIIFLAFSMCSHIFADASPGQDPVRAKAEQGDPVAQDRLGFVYYIGESRHKPPDYAEAMRWFRKAAEQGNANAQSHLGTMYYLGAGVPRDYAEALSWFRKAAEQGDDHAQRKLAEMYALGLGVPRDHAESEKWSRRVAEHNRPAQPRDFYFNFWPIALIPVFIAFAWGMVAIRKEPLPKWKQLFLIPIIHLTGLVLVLNSINTYGFQLFFPKCGRNGLAPSCSQYKNPGLVHFIEALGNLQILNLLFRFMMIMGLGLDVLALWYLVYLYKKLFRRPALLHDVRARA